MEVIYNVRNKNKVAREYENVYFDESSEFFHGHYTSKDKQFQTQEYLLLPKYGKRKFFSSVGLLVIVNIKVSPQVSFVFAPSNIVEHHYIEMTDRKVKYKVKKGKIIITSISEPLQNPNIKSLTTSRQLTVGEISKATSNDLITLLNHYAWNKVL